MCSGMITQFRVCYYDPSLYHPPTNIVPVGLQVWRFDDQFQSGNLIYEHSASIDIQDSIPFQCRYFVLNETIAIAEGDVLGVRIFEGAVVPAVGNIDPVFAPNILHIAPANYSTSILRRTLPEGSVLGGNAIHLTADVAAPVATTAEVTQGGAKIIPWFLNDNCIIVAISLCVCDITQKPPHLVLLNLTPLNQPREPPL